MRIVRLSSNNKQKQRGKGSSRVNDSDVAAQKYSQEQRALLSLLHASRIGAKANFAVGVAAACVHIFVSPCCSPGAPVRVPVCVCEYVLLLCLSRLVVWPLDKIVCACSLPPASATVAVTPPRTQLSLSRTVRVLVCVCVCVSE